MERGLTGQTSATAFGLDLRSQIPLSFLENSNSPPTGRVLEISALGDGESLDWPQPSKLISSRLDSAGKEYFRIEAHPQAGYLISAQDYGFHLLSCDGRQLVCDPGSEPEKGWQRLLSSQVLPFAAVLQGLEVLHASAVTKRGQAVAILGESGAGKSSVAMALCGLGADFLADDVLALEIGDGGLLAHPALGLASLRDAEVRRLEEAGELQEERIIEVNEHERLLLMELSEPASLEALFFLERHRDGPARPRFEPVSDAEWLLSATFNFVLDTPVRLRRLLEVCALAARCRVERILAGPAVDATTLAVELQRRLDGTK